jgi:hypothetical protein
LRIVFLLILSLPAIPAGLILAKSRYLEDDLDRQRGRTA